MEGRLGGILSDFEGDLDRIDQLLHLVESLREFGASKVGEHEEESEFVQGAIKLRDELVGDRTDLPVLSGALLGYLAGRFEYFARSCVEAVADEIADQCSCFENIPDSLQRSVIRKTGEVVQNPDKFGYDAASIRGIVTDLGRGLEARAPLSAMPWKVVSLTEGNLRPGTLGELFKRVGVDGLWREVGKQAEMKAYLKLKEDKDTTRSAQSRLEEIMDARNAIAHPTGTEIFAGPDKVMGWSLFLRTLAREIVKVSRVSTTTFSEAPDGA